MRLFLAGFAAMALAFALAAPGRAATTVPPINYHVRTLATGLKVYSVLDRTTPNVSVQVWYGVGAKNDPAGR
jgi:zinc protease